MYFFNKKKSFYFVLIVPSNSTIPLVFLADLANAELFIFSYVRQNINSYNLDEFQTKPESSY